MTMTAAAAWLNTVFSVFDKVKLRSAVIAEAMIRRNGCIALWAIHFLPPIKSQVAIN